MKLNNIREMSDKELYTFINKISNQNGRICCRCGTIVYKENRVTLSRTIGVAPKKICCLCKDCYTQLLDWLGINDCD